jgi:hypothetical protein
MTRLTPLPPDNLDHAAASILEPEVPAGGSSFLYRRSHQALRSYPKTPLQGRFAHERSLVDRCHQRVSYNYPYRSMAGHVNRLGFLDVT